MSTVITRMAQKDAGTCVQVTRLGAGNRKIKMLLTVDQGSGFEYKSIELTKKQSINLALKIIEAMTELDAD